MKSIRDCVMAAVLLALALPASLAAQDNATQNHTPQHHHYQLIDVGTFGGPQSWQFNPGVARNGLLNNRGTLVGSADTSALDPYCLDYPDCYAAHAFQWRNGGKTDLGVLPGGIDSQVFWVSANGLMAGVSDNGQQDPLNPALPQIHAVLWEHGQVTDLGTLEGGYNSGAAAINSRGEIVGEAYNTIPDPNSLFGYGYQSRAVYWNNGVVQDLGTLGTGTDAVAGLINEHGQVVGMSYTSSVPNALCPGISAFTLTTGSFLWDRKSGMKDIGGLGGTCTLANDLNNQGQIVGGSALTGDTQVHPFVWNTATGVIDLLDSSDSSYGFAEGENEHGDVAGGTCDSVTCYALLWRKSGGKWQKSTLSAVADNAFSISINASEQVIGNFAVTNGQAAFLWEDSGPFVDLDTLIPSGSGLQMYEADQINDRGEIVAQGVDASGNNHAVLLIPCDENHSGVEGCDYSLVDAATASRVSPAPAIQHPAALTPHRRMLRGMLNHSRFSRGQRTPGSVTNPAAAAEQTSSANTGNVDSEGEQLLGPLAGHYRGYCTVYGGKLTGYCTAYSYYSCAVKVSTACPSGKTATKPGYFRCSDRFSRYVDLGRGCGFN
jgi:probable HAF family extracellular repeat protein